MIKWLNSENYGKNIHASSGNLVMGTKGTVFSHAGLPRMV